MQDSKQEEIDPRSDKELAKFWNTYTYRCELMLGLANEELNKKIRELEIINTKLRIKLSELEGEIAKIRSG